MEDDGTISERGPLGRGIVDRLIGLKYLRSAILETHVIVQNSVFQGYLSSRTNKNPQKPQNFCPLKTSSYMVNLPNKKVGIVVSLIYKHQLFPTIK